MAPKIEYIFSTISPWAYIGHALLLEIAEKHKAEIEFIPVQLLDLFAGTGGLPLPKRHPARQNYGWYEAQRWREVRKVGFNLKPKHWPFNFIILDKFVVSATEMNHNPSLFLMEAMKGIWANDLKLSDEDVILDLAEKHSLPGEELLAKSKTDEIAARYSENTKNSIEKQCFGSPTYFLNGEMFFGQDRLEQLDDALTTGRAPYTIPK